MLALAPAFAKAKSTASALWAKPWVRKATAIVASALLAATCEFWPQLLRPVCMNLVPFLELTLGG